MRTNIVIDDNLIKDAQKISGIKTKKEIIHLALEEFIKNKKRKDLSNLFGKIEFRSGYNYKSMRK